MHGLADLSGAVAKTGPVVVPPLVAGLSYAGIDGHFLLKVGAVSLGLLFGAMWRAGMLRSEGKGWVAVRADLTVSALIGGGNAILCLAIAEIFGLGALLAMGTGVVIGATGLRALPALRGMLLNSLQRWALGNNVAVVEPTDGTPTKPNPALEEAVRQLKAQEGQVDTSGK